MAILLRPRSAAGGGGTPIPSQPVTGAAAWYDASIESSLTIVSNRVSQWDDLSGNGRHLTQGTAADRPAYDAAPRMINSIVCPEFTPSNEFMDSALDMGDRTSTHFLVLYPDAISTEFTPIGSTGGTGGLEFHYSNTHVRIAKGGIAYLFDVPMLPSAATTWIFCVRMEAATITVTSGGVVRSGADATALTAGRTLRMGTDQSGTLPFDGLIGEYVAYTTVLSDADIYTNFVYLINKWT
jgi:hypothetical protein